MLRRALAPSEVHMHRGQLREAAALMELAQAAAAEAKMTAAEIECCRASFLLAYHMGDIGRCSVRGAILGHRRCAWRSLYGGAGHLRTGIAWVAARREVTRTREKFATAIAIFEELGLSSRDRRRAAQPQHARKRIGNFAGAIADTERALEMFDVLGDNRARRDQPCESRADPRLARRRRSSPRGRRRHRRSRAAPPTTFRKRAP